MKGNISLRAVLVLAVAILGLAAGPAAWGAVPVAITNADFENPVLGEGAWQRTIPSWSQGWYNLGAADPTAWVDVNLAGDAGVYNVSAGEYTGAAAPEGQNMSFVDGYAGYEYGINQVLLGRTSALQKDATYVLSATVGNPYLYNGDLAPNYRIELVADGTVLASATGASPADDLSWATPSLTYNSGAAPAKLGQQLEIRLIAANDARNAGYEVDFDAVLLKATYTHPISDPDGSYTVIGGAGSLSLSGTGSLPSDGSSLSLYEWDLNNDGTYDVTGATPAAISYATLTGTYGMVTGSNTVGLRVTDATTAETAVATTIVIMTGGTAPTPPTAIWDIAPGTVGVGNGSITGGNGTWDTSNGNWTSDGGANNVAWVNANNDTAVFGGTAGTVTLGEAITVGGLQFNTTGYIISTGGNTLTFGDPNNTIAFSNTTTTAQAATITGTVGGAGNVTLLTPGQGASTGTLTLNGTSAGGWSGATTVNSRTTMALAASNQALLSTSGITLSGGGITLTNTNTTEAALDRVSNTAPITSNGGTITFTNTSGADLVYAETIGSVALTSGQLDIVEATNQTNATNNTQTLTLSGLTHPGATSVVTFSAATTGPQASGNKNMIVVTGGGTTSAGQIIGPWATVGTAAANQTDYAVYNADYVVPAAIAASGEGTWASATDAYTVSGGATLSGTRTITALRAIGAAQTLALGANNLETSGLLNGGTDLLTVSGTGALRTPAGGGNLFLTAGNNAITVSAPINDNGGAVTLVKSGSGMLTLSSTTSSFSGGTVVNAGALSVSATANLGSGGITFNSSATIWTSGWLSGASWPIALNNGAIATFTTGGWDFQFYTTGAVTGNGGVLVYGGGDAGTPLLKLRSTANTFTGPIYIGISSRNGLVYVNSLADSDSPIQFGYGTAANGFRTGCYLVYDTGATADLVLNQRYFVVSAANSANGILNDSGKALTVNTDLRVTAAGSTKLSLGGTGAGLSTFAGKIVDGPSGALSLTKAESGTWVLSGANTYTGGTTLSAGTLRANGAGALSAGPVTVSAGTLLIIDAADAMADTAALYLPSATTKNLTMNADDTIASLFLGGIQQPNGIYTNSGLGSAWMNAGIGKLLVGSLASLPVYWDLNGNTAGSGATSGDATGTWNATNTYWNPAAAGTDATMVWTGGAAVFAAGTDASGPYIVTVDGTRDIGGLTFEEGSVTLSPGTAGGLRMTANSLLSVATGLTATVATPISQDATARSLTKAGAGTLVLSGSNSYTGATTITSGTLSVASLANAGADSPIGNYPTAGAAGLSLNGGTLQYTGGSTASDRGFTLAAASTVDVNVGTALTLGDCSMGAYALNVTGGAGSSLGLGAVTLTGAATLNPTTASLTVASVAGANQNLTLGGTATGSAVTGGIATGSGTVTKNGTGTWTLSGTNTWTGQTTISAGTLVFAGASTLPPAAAQIGVGNGGTLRLQQDGGGVTVNNLCNSGGRGIVATYEADRLTPGDATGLNYVFTKTCYNIDNGSTLNVQAGPNITSGTPTVDFSNASGTRGLMCWDNTSGPATVVATGVNLRVNGISGGNCKTLTLSGNTTGNEVYGPIEGNANNTGGLIKAGTGTWTLSGTNTYPGPTTVNSGTLALSGAGAVNSSSGITLNGPTAAFMQNSSVANSRTFTLTQGTLGGTGTISTPITIGANVTIAPGDRTLASPAAGTLTIANNVNLTDGTTEMRLFSPTESDTLAQSTTGGLGYGGILKIIAVNSLAFAVGNNWDLFDFDSQSGTFSNDSDFGTVGGGSTYLPLLTIGKKWSFDYTSGILSVILGLIPGDADKNGVVDAADYITVKQNFGMASGATWEMGNFSDPYGTPGTVDWADLQILMANFGTRSIGGAPATPEPGSVMLLMFGAAALLRRRAIIGRTRR